ncbi:hypothetical protein KR018_003948, partial [Drosophila ironensis]
EETIAKKEVPAPPEVQEEVQKTQPRLNNSISSQEVSEVSSVKEVPSVKVEDNQSVSNEIPKVEEPQKEEAIPQGPKPAEGQGRDFQVYYDQNGQALNQLDLDKIFKYPAVQVQTYNGSHSLSQYQGLYNKFGSYPQVVTVDTDSNANVTHHIHNHTHYYNNQKKPGFPFPFLPNPFEKQETTYVNPSGSSSSSSTSGNVTHHVHVHEESKPFPFLPNPFTDFPKVVGLSLVLLPNPFYVNKTHSQVVSSSASGSASAEVTYSDQFFGKFRGFSDEAPQKQEQQQKPAFYLIPNPLAQQAASDGRFNKGDANVLLPVNLAALPLLVPAPDFSQGKASASSGSINIQDVLKASNVHVSEPLKLQANNGLSQLQKEQAAVQQFLISHLTQQQQLFQKQNLLNEKRSQSAAGVGVQEEEESSVLFAVEIPKPIYRFFKGIFGGFSK